MYSTTLHQQTSLSSVSFMSSWQSELMSHKEDSLIQWSSKIWTRTVPKRWVLWPRHEVASLIKSIFFHYEEINVVWFINVGYTGLSAVVKEEKKCHKMTKSSSGGDTKTHHGHTPGERSAGACMDSLSLSLSPSRKINDRIKWRSVILILLFMWWMAAHRGALVCQAELSVSWVIGF